MACECDTLIVGGGISGLACARRLCDAGHDFVLVTDRLGGRIYHSENGTRNFGAMYISADYHNVLPFVDRGPRFRLREAYGYSGGQPTTVYHPSNLPFARSGLRLMMRLFALRKEMNAFRRRAANVPHVTLRSAFPLIDRYSRQSALEIVEELQLDEFHRRYFRLAFRTTAFTEPENASALYYLVSLFPLFIPTWTANFKNTYQRLTKGYEDRIRRGRVVSVSRQRGDGWRVEDAAGAVYIARRVVIAAPHHNAKELYPVPQPKLATAATVQFVKGQRKQLFDQKVFIGYDDGESDITAVWRQPSGEDLVYSLSEAPQLDGIFDEYEVLDKATWKTAVVIPADTWAPLVLEPRLYLAGDYNFCGLEDSYITGLCAANTILDE